MNVVGFFIANQLEVVNYQKILLRVSSISTSSLIGINSKILDEVKKTNVAVCKTQGYDEFYIVPGQVQEVY